MLKAISRYGARVLPNTQQIINGCRRRGELVRGPQIAEFEREFARRFGAVRAVSTSLGRMAFYYILRAMDLPKGSEVVFPALTFWVVPEMARAAGLRPVFADVDPRTFNLDPGSLERAITPDTRAVVPTHLYGLPCDMDPILEIARKHGLKVIEDCAHALGARYRGRLVGTFGDAAFFSFQTLKPLNTYGGGMASTGDGALGRRIADLAAAEPWPTERRVLLKLWKGRAERVFTRPAVFTYTGFPILWAASFTGLHPDVYLWERIRPLNPLPQGYGERYANVQAALGLEGLERLEQWTQQTRAHARFLDERLRGLPDTGTPFVPPDRDHVYYQYCLYVPDRDALVKGCIRRGVDIEVLHVDVCTRLALFGDRSASAPGAERAAGVVQLPVYSSLTDAQMRKIARVVTSVLLALRERTGIHGRGGGP
jgi:dTDP-4-amino-4,6-dideoxygalactose transaminase